MTAISHGLAGTAIALVVKEPILALPLAFLSHFVLDILPHFGLSFEFRKRNVFISNLYMTIELLFLGALTAFLYSAGVSWVVFASLILAISPDIAWVYRFYIQEQFRKLPEQPRNWFNEFHARIQWSETIFPGLLIEIFFAISLLVFVVNNV